MILYVALCLYRVLILLIGTPGFLGFAVILSAGFIGILYAKGENPNAS
jgi:hypothetical protein